MNMDFSKGIYYLKYVKLYPTDEQWAHVNINHLAKYKYQIW